MHPAARRFTVLALAALFATSAVAEERGPAGYPGRGRIGIEVQSMTAELREFFAAPPEYGLLIVRVEPGRPAKLADLRVGDIVVAAAGEPLARPHDLVAIVARAAAATPIELTIVREGKQQRIAVTPDGDPATAAALDAWHRGLPDFAPVAEAASPIQPASGASAAESPTEGGAPIPTE
jgi:serine protease Do